MFRGGQAPRTQIDHGFWRGEGEAKGLLRHYWNLGRAERAARPLASRSGRKHLVVRPRLQADRASRLPQSGGPCNARAYSNQNSSSTAWTTRSRVNASFLKHPRLWPRLPSLQGFRSLLSGSHKTIPRPLRHRVQCPASASKVVGRAVDLVGSHSAAVNSRWHAITTFVVADEVAQADAVRSVRSQAHQEVARSSDKVNDKFHGLSSASTVKSWVTTRVTVAIAQAMAMIKVKGALEIWGSADLRAALTRTSSTRCRPSAPYPSKRPSERKVRLLKPHAAPPTAFLLPTSADQQSRRPFIKVESCWRFMASSMAFSARVC